MADLVWTRNRGRDGWEDPLDVPTDQSVEARNVHLYDGGLGTRRGGSAAVTISGVSGIINALIEYIPGQDQTAAELFLVDSSNPKKIFRCAAGSSFSSLTLKDNIATEPYVFSAVVLNKKLYCAYDSTVNRLHVFDPGYSTSEVRRAGLAPFAAAATVANTGSGSYAAALRYYKTRSVEQQSSIVIRRSEANASVSFTPSGSGTAARITRPTAVSEGETHWEVYGSTDDVTYYGPIATIAIATTTYDDSSTITDWDDDFDAEPEAGTYTPFPSVKSLGTTGTRLYGLGVWESAAGDALAPKNGRFYFGPVLDSTATHDDERINNTTALQGFIDLARNSGAVDRGVTPKPINNVIYAFQSLGVYGLVPTESDTAPYRRIVLSSEIGNIAQQAIVLASNRNGQSCCYFLDPVLGPYTVGGPDGLRWCGKDVADVWATVNKDATAVVACGAWFPDRSQVIFAVATGSSNDPNLMLVLDPTEQVLDEEGDLRGGWTTYDGDFAAARCIALFSNTLSATRSRTRTPYIGLATSSKLLRYDESVHKDATTAFQAYITSGAKAVDTRVIELKKAYVVASSETDVTLRQTLIRNTGDETNRTSDVSLTPVGSETTVLKKFEDAALQDAWAFQVQLGDSAAQDVAWQVLQWRAKVTSGAEF